MSLSSQNYSQRRTGYNSRYDEDGYRRDGSRKIQGYSQSQGPVRTYGGLNEYYALQDRNNRAFADPRFPGKSAGEISQNAQATNKQINKYGQAEDAYQNRFSQWAQGQRQENIRKAKADGSFARKRTEYNKANMGKREMLTDGTILGDDGGRDQYTGINLADRERIDPNWGSTYDGESAKEIEAGEKKGEAEPKDKVMEGKIPNESHSSPYESAYDTLPTPKPSPRMAYKDGTTTISSKYGTGTATKRTADTPASTVKDHFGRDVPMADYLHRRRYAESLRGGWRPFAGKQA